MLKLLRMEDPVKGVCSLKFICPCHIDADTGLIPTESGPDFSSTLAEGDSRTRLFSQQEMGPAKQAAYHLNRENSSVGRLAASPKRTVRRRNMIPQEGEEAVFLPCPVRPTPLEGFSGTRRGRIEDGSPSVSETHGVNG
jgi:hypothetical protein